MYSISTSRWVLVSNVVMSGLAILAGHICPYSLNLFRIQNTVEIDIFIFFILLLLIIY